MIAVLRYKLGDFLRKVGGTFTVPFPGLPVVMWAYFILSYLALPQNPIWRGDLPDPDDYTYLTQTLDWLQGQGWYDNIQHRMSSPEGVAIHYTRLAELPIAGVIMLFRALGHSWNGAAMLGSLLLPVLYLGLLFAALRWAAQAVVGKDWANLTSVVAMFGAELTFKFAPGQVDHHGLETILTIVGVGAVMRLFARPDQVRWGVVAGFILALALAIALETLPWVVLTSGVIGLWALAQGREAVRGVLVFAASLLAFSALFLIIEKPVSEIWQPDLLAYSIAYVALCGGVALALIAAALSSRLQSLTLRVAFSGLVAVILGALYLWRFPALLAGPYGAMDPKLADLFFTNLEEAVPIVSSHSLWRTLLIMFPSLLGLVSAVHFWRKSQGAVKWSWLLLAFSLAAAVALAAFYQSRVYLYAILFSILPLTAFAKQGWAWIGAHYQGRRRFWAEIFLILLLGPLTAIFLPALTDGRSFNTGVILFPVRTAEDYCQAQGLAKILNSPAFASRGPLRIVNTLGEGPELLFRTKHTVMSAPYHTNVRGNLDALDFFSTTDAAKAHDIARRDGIDLVVLCKEIPDLYLQKDGAHYAILPNGEMHMRPDASFAGQLALHRLPDWLMEIPMPDVPNYLLFTVK